MGGRILLSQKLKALSDAVMITLTGGIKAITKLDGGAVGHRSTSSHCWPFMPALQFILDGYIYRTLYFRRSPPSRCRRSGNACPLSLLAILLASRALN